MATGFNIQNVANDSNAPHVRLESNGLIIQNFWTNEFGCYSGDTRKNIIPIFQKEIYL